MKRIALLLLAAFVCAPSLLRAEHKTLRIAQGYIAADILPLWVAKERTLFEKYGLDTTITYVRGGKNIVAALLSDQSDIAVILPSSLRKASFPCLTAPTRCAPWRQPTPYEKSSYQVHRTKPWQKSSLRR